MAPNLTKTVKHIARCALCDVDIMLTNISMSLTMILQSRKRVEQLLAQESVGTSSSSRVYSRT